MKKLLKYGIIVIIIIAIIVFGINLYVKISTNKQIIKENDYTELSDVDCIIILGAGIWGDKPSPMLEDRLLEGIKLYQNSVSDKIIMSGDHGRKEYDEVNIMKNYAIEKTIEAGSTINEVATPRQGMATSDVNRFIKFWHEVSFIKIGLNKKNHEEALESKCKWFPHNKGGGIRKWYGNNEESCV